MALESIQSLLLANVAPRRQSAPSSAPKPGSAGGIAADWTEYSEAHVS